MGKLDQQITAMVNGIQTLTNLVNSQNQAIGVINQTVQALDARLGNVESQGESNANRIAHLEEDQFVDLICADNIRLSAQNKVAQILSIEFDERGGVTDESMYVYKKYFGKFVGRLHVDARHAGLEGPRIYATPRKNYEALLKFIDNWMPKRGVKGLMSYYDGLEAARKEKKRNHK